MSPPQDSPDEGHAGPRWSPRGARELQAQPPGGRTVARAPRQPTAGWERVTLRRCNIPGCAVTLDVHWPGAGRPRHRQLLAEAARGPGVAALLTGPAALLGQLHVLRVCVFHPVPPRPRHVPVGRLPQATEAWDLGGRRRVHGLLRPLRGKVVIPVYREESEERSGGPAPLPTTSHARPGLRPRDTGTGESASLEHLQRQQASGLPQEGQLPEHRPHLCPRGHGPLQESKSPVCGPCSPPRAREQPAFPLHRGAHVPAQSRVTHSAAGQAGCVAGPAQTCCPGTLRTPRHNVCPEAAAWVCTAASGSSGTRPPALCPCGRA